MRLRRIDLPGFGCLAGFRAEFAPGVNVFFGDNEAGKSTLQQAVCALLYGFFDGDRARPDETARHERFRPWPDGRAATPYRGSLEYELEDGRAFEVRRDFSSGDVPTQLIDLVTGADVASQYGQGRHGNVPFARKQVGMSRAVFQSCAFIGQGEVMEVSNGASPREIGDAIAALADSSRRDVSAKAAIDRLNALLQKIGSDRARTAELPSARESLGVAEAELAALETAQREVAQSAADLRTARARLAPLERDMVRGQVLFLKARGASLERKLKELVEAEAAQERAAAAMKDLAGFAEFPSGQRDTVLRLRDRLAAERERAGEARRALEERRDRVPEAARLEFEALRSSVGSLSDESISALRGMAYATAEVTSQRPNLLARLWRGVAAFVSTLLRAVLRRTEADEEEEQPPAPAMSREEAQALLERHTRYLTLRPDVEALAASEARLRTAEAALTSTEDELRGVLATAMAVPGWGLDEGVADFLEGCKQHTLYEVAEAEGEEAVRRRKLLLGEKSPDELRGQSDECDRRLAALVAANPELAGIEPDTGAGEIAKRLEGLQAESRALEVRVARLEEEVRSSLKDHRARAEIEEDAERWRREVTRLEAARAAAQVARDAISEAMVAVYRDFAPAVNAFLSEGFDYITEGRYQRAHVDPATLRVSLLLPETGRVITDPPVSRGTLTAAYILMRMGLAHHMSAIGEPVPLVLDDPFVDLDGHRLERMLEFVMGISAGTQVLLFTKDTQIADWFKTMDADGRHALHLLSPAALVTSAL
jgi:DNA repair exonuclease SbcCD ATPase subunit